jgi:hypothetical protein
MADERDNTLFRVVGLGQATYYVTTGVWSLIHRRSFEAITGPKVDYWLVRTVGVLVMAIGSAIGIAAARGKAGPETPVLAIGSAAGLAAIGAVYPVRGRISKVYLLDVIAEVALIAMWVKVLVRRL